VTSIGGPAGKPGILPAVRDRLAVEACMDELRVPKRRIPVEVLLPGGGTAPMVLFLAEVAAGHAGGERPSDLLNGHDEFVPAFDEVGQAMSFLSRSAISALRLDAALDEALEDDVSLPTEHDVEVRLSDGTVLRGLVTYLRPPDRSRLGDFLNEPPPFFRLREASSLVLVNKRHVVRVTLVPR
jgi:hypothetical protein